MNLTVIVVCSSDILIEKCLNSIDEDVQTIVVLNHPTPDVERIVQQFAPDAVLRHDERNLGLLRQLAAEAATTARVVYIDSDCAFTPGTLRSIDSALDEYPAVSVPMRYRHTGPITHAVSRCRQFTTPDSALLIPAAYDLSIQSRIGGHLYDPRLAWGEDSDPSRRIRAAGLGIGTSKGLVWHRALGVRDDAASARRLGMGRRLRERILGDSPRVGWRDLLGRGELRGSIACSRYAGLGAALYHLFVWRPSYKIGYWLERCRHG